MLLIVLLVLKEKIFEYFSLGSNVKTVSADGYHLLDGGWDHWTHLWKLLSKDYPCNACFKFYYWFQRRTFFNIFPTKSSYLETMSADADFPKLADKLSDIRTDRLEGFVRPKDILPVRKKNKKNKHQMLIISSKDNR